MRGQHLEDRPLTAFLNGKVKQDGSWGGKGGQREV